MSGSLQNDLKRAAIPAASALLLASALSLRAAQEPDFSSLKMPGVDTNPVPAQVEKRTAAQAISAEGSAPVTQKTNYDKSPTEPKHKTPHIPPEEKSKLGIAAGLVSLVASGFFIRQTFKNGETSKLGWVVTTVNEGLIAITSFALGSINNFWLPASFVIGSGTTMLAALRWGKKEPLTDIEKISAKVAAAGWLLYLCNPHDPVWAAIAGQVGYHASNLSFMELFYKKPEKITITGQALYLASAALNICAITAFVPKEVISPIGIGIGILLSSTALGLGHLRRWREARRGAGAD